MKYEPWIWGAALVIFTLLSGAGILAAVPEVLIALPAALYAIGAGAFCLGDSKPRTQARVIACGLAGLLSVMATFHLPLRAAFLVSRGGLEEAADWRPGDRVAPAPRRAGIYRIVSVDRSEENITYLWLPPTPNTRPGFAKLDPAEPLRAAKDIRLGGPWRFVVK